MKKVMILMILVFSFVLIGCDSDGTNLEVQTQNTSDSTTAEAVNVEDVVNDDIDFDNGEYEDYTEDTYVTLDGNSSSYTITEEGTYVLTGTITESIIVELADDEDVRFVLDNVTIETSENAAIMILSADDVVISVLEGTTNYISDSSTYSTTYAEYNATIYSEADLVINGSGTLNVDANYNNAIQSKDDLMIVDVVLNVTSVDDGIIGRDSLLVQNATITVDISGDGLKSTNDSNLEEGYIYVESGTFVIEAGADGIDAINYIVIDNGTFDITSGDQGITSDTSIYISNGTFVIDAVDDALNADDSVNITGGTFDIDSNDDAIKADTSITIDGGIINIHSSYEGIESRSITINGGIITLVASDDGINISGGSTSYMSFDGTSSATSEDDGSSTDDGTTNDNTTTTRSSTDALIITGGVITVSASGDGIDINGGIRMTGGEIYIYGPSSDNEGSIDYDSYYYLTSGVLFAIGSNGMAQAPSSVSSQASIMLGMTSSVSSGTEITVTDSDGNIIFNVTTQKSGINIVISVPEFNVGDSYTITVGSYELDFTLSSTVTYLGNTSSSGGLPNTPGGRPR